MSTFLDLSNRILTRLNEVPLTAGTFAGAQGVHAQVKDGVNNAVAALCQDYDEWPFLWVPAELKLAHGVESYALPDTMVRLDVRGTYIDAGLGEEASPLAFIPYDQWRDKLATEFINYSSLDRPVGYTLAPGNRLLLYPWPSKDYTVKYGYWRTAPRMVSATDACVVPTGWDNVVEEGAYAYVMSFRVTADEAAVLDKKFRDKIKNMKRRIVPRVTSVYA